MLHILLSHPVSINRGIIQGSGIGPTLYIGMKSDLKVICTDNVLIKYADDVDLLVPENSKVQGAANKSNPLQCFVNISTTNLNFYKKIYAAISHPYLHITAKLCYIITTFD